MPGIEFGQGFLLMRMEVLGGEVSHFCNWQTINTF